MYIAKYINKSTVTADITMTKLTRYVCNDYADNKLVYAHVSLEQM